MPTPGGGDRAGSGRSRGAPLTLTNLSPLTMSAVVRYTPGMAPRKPEARDGGAQVPKWQTSYRKGENPTVELRTPGAIGRGASRRLELTPEEAMALSQELDSAARTTAG